MIDSIRVAAMEAIFFNLTGARFQLPHGGYGLTGVCNDSAAMIQYALFGKNDGKSLKKILSRGNVVQRMTCIHSRLLLLP